MSRWAIKIPIDQFCQPVIPRAPAFLDPCSGVECQHCREYACVAVMNAMKQGTAPLSDDAPDPGLIVLAEGQTVDLNQAVAWLRHRWQFALSLYFIRLLAVPLHLPRVSADQLELALVKPKAQHLLAIELLCKLCWPADSPHYLGKDFSQWETVLKERMQAMYGDDTAESSLSSQHWLSMSLQFKVNPLFKHQE